MKGRNVGEVSQDSKPTRKPRKSVLAQDEGVGRKGRHGGDKIDACEVAASRGSGGNEAGGRRKERDGGEREEGAQASGSGPVARPDSALSLIHI